MGSRGGKIHLRQKKREALDRVELRPWMENAPRNIPGIVWEQFSRQPRNDVSFPLRYKSPEVAGDLADCFSSPKGASKGRDYQQTDRLSEGITKDSSEDRPVPSVG